MHNKSFTVDNQTSILGGRNIGNEYFEADPNAAFSDQNIAQIAFKLELHKDERGDEQIRWFGFENGRPRIFEVEPYSGFWRRFGVSFMSLMPIESQL